MKDQLVSYKTAVLAKEKGFEGFCQYYWDAEYENNITQFNYYEGSEYNGFSKYNNPDNIEDKLLLPTQNLVVKWIREKHNIHIYVMPSDFINNPSKTLYKGICITHFELEAFESFEEAMEETLYQSLLLIK